MRSIKEFWKRIDGPLGAIFLLGFVFNVGYLVRGYEDGGFVATLIERIHSARLDERAQCEGRVQDMQTGYQERSKLRDAQVATLIQQNKALIELVKNTSASRSRALRDAIDAANKAADSAGSADKKATEINKRLDTATQPAAVVPHKDWGKQ